MIRLEGCNLITIKEAAEVLEVSPSRVTQFIDEERLGSRKILGRHLLRQKEVKRFARTRQRRSGPPT